MKIQYVHGQVITFSLRALHRFGKAMACMARGDSGSIVDDHLETMKRHINFVQECIDDPAFAPDDEDPTR